MNYSKIVQKIKWLFDPALGQCPHTGIWTLVFIEGHGMFYRLCQMHDTSQPTTGLKVWNTSQNMRYQQATVRLHFNSPSENANTMHCAVVSTEKMKKSSYFIQEEQSKEKRVNAAALQIRANQWSITANLWPLTAHIYHVMIIVTSGFSKKSIYYYFYFVEILSNNLELFLQLSNI